MGKRVIEIIADDIESMLNADEPSRFTVRAITADNIKGRVLVTVDDTEADPVPARDEPTMLATHVHDGRLKVVEG